MGCLSLISSISSAILPSSSREYRLIRLPLACVEAYRRTLDSRTFTGAIRMECLNRYATQLGLDPAVASPLAALVWAIHAASDYRAIEADLAGGHPGTGILRQSVFLNLWYEEVQQMERSGGDAPRKARCPVAQEV